MAASRAAARVCAARARAARAASSGAASWAVREAARGHGTSREDVKTTREERENVTTSRKDARALASLDVWPSGAIDQERL